MKVTSPRQVERQLENYKSLVNIGSHFQEYKEKLQTPPTHFDGLTPYETVEKHYTLPFPLYPFQQDTVNKLAPLKSAGYYLDVGAGKTATSIASFLFKLNQGMAEKLVVIMPPILIDGWFRTLEKYPQLKGQTTVYRGTPKKRSEIKLGSTLITLMGLQIFKQDYEDVAKAFANVKTTVILDEAAHIKNVSSQNYRAFRQFTADKDTMLLTGTPLSTPIDGYAYISFTAPGLYRNLSVFETRYVGERDFFGQIVSWRRLEELNEHLKINSVRILKQDVLKDLPEVTYTPLHYSLNKPHYDLYKKLVLEELLVLEDGGKIDATTASGMYHKLGQLICNYDYFSGKEGARSTCFDVIDQTLEELDGQKLVIFSSYRMTNRNLAEYLTKYNAVSAFGDNTVPVNNANILKFVNDPTCQILIGQPSSIGVGVDGLQDVCCNVLFLEIPSLTMFHQSVARLHRAGQKQGVHVRIAVAQGTLQETQCNNLLQKDALVNKVIRNVTDLRQALFGQL